MNDSIRVLVAENQAIVRIGLVEAMKNEPGIDIIGDASAPSL
jgi:DNA-binding NarL/FixJ family response regulator